VCVCVCVCVFYGINCVLLHLPFFVHCAFSVSLGISFLEKQDAALMSRWNRHDSCLWTPLPLILDSRIVDWTTQFSITYPWWWWWWWYHWERSQWHWMQWGNIKTMENFLSLVWDLRPTSLPKVPSLTSQALSNFVKMMMQFLQIQLIAFLCSLPNPRLTRFECFIGRWKF